MSLAVQQCDECDAVTVILEIQMRMNSPDYSKLATTKLSTTAVPCRSSAVGIIAEALSVPVSTVAKREGAALTCS